MELNLVVIICIDNAEEFYMYVYFYSTLYVLLAFFRWLSQEVISAV